MSNETVDTAIAEGLAALTRQTATPTPPLLWGADVACWDDIDPSREVDPGSIEAIAQDMHHRLRTPRGKMPGDPSYGWDLLAELHTGQSLVNRDGLARRVRAEVSKDDRLAGVAVTVEQPAAAQRIRIVIHAVPVDPTVGSFRAIMVADNTALLLEEIHRL